MKSKTIWLILVACLCSLWLLGCGAGASVKPLGNNVYSIEAISFSGPSGANEEFNAKAVEICPSGYDVLNSNVQILAGSTHMTGSIRCK